MQTDYDEIYQRGGEDFVSSYLTSLDSSQTGSHPKRYAVFGPTATTLKRVIALDMKREVSVDEIKWKKWL